MASNTGAGGRGRKSTSAHKSNSRGVSPKPLDRGLHAIDATPARRRDGAVLAPLDSVVTAAPRRASDSLVDLRIGMPGGMPDMSGMGGMGGAPAEEPADEGPKIEEID